MLPVKKILCPLDFSDFSLQALQDAAELAQHFGAELHVLHVIQVIETAYGLAPFPQTVSWDMTTYKKAARSGAEQELRETLEKLKLPDIPIFSAVHDGQPADEIVEFARRNDIDLVVIPTHGRSGWRHVVFGSVAEKVVRLSPCRVLVTHSRSEIPA